jgi:2-aminobenzoate-CoA ligase
LEVLRANQDTKLLPPLPLWTVPIVSVPGYPASYTSHVDHFARESLPSPERWPLFEFNLSALHYPERVNCATVLLDSAVAEGHGSRIAIYAEGENWRYADLLERSNRIANVLVREFALVPGNRVLLRAPNCPMLIAAWLAVIKAGAIAVTTMPMLRAKELVQIVTKARIDHALCAAHLIDEIRVTNEQTGRVARALTWGDGVLEDLMRRQPATFSNVDTARDDVCLLAFTSGTTGEPKATMHFQRDVLVMADLVGGYLLETDSTDVYVGSPPLGFTFGLGALLVFPLRFRAATVMVQQPSADALLSAVQKYRATCVFTAPTMYRTLTAIVPRYDVSSLRSSVSAGEALSKPVSDAWNSATGIRLIDGLGATEMTHIFISAKGNDIRPGATGKALPGYEAVVLDEGGRTLPRGSAGRLAVRGPTGCRYLNDERQKQYVVDGWNVTGDRYLFDEDGYFWFQARIDDMIVSSGYNIAAAEVESALSAHPAVSEVAVIGIPDEARGQIVKAYIVLTSGLSGDATLSAALQEFVKSTMAPYKYPRAIEFVAALPKSQTGKVQRFVLRQQAHETPSCTSDPEQGGIK